jgi:hypothetical protein
VSVEACPVCFSAARCSSGARLRCSQLLAQRRHDAVLARQLSLRSLRYKQAGASASRAFCCALPRRLLGRCARCSARARRVAPPPQRSALQRPQAPPPATSHAHAAAQPHHATRARQTHVQSTSTRADACASSAAEHAPRPPQRQALRCLPVRLNRRTSRLHRCRPTQRVRARRPCALRRAQRAHGRGTGRGGVALFQFRLPLLSRWRSWALSRRRRRAAARRAARPRRHAPPRRTRRCLAAPPPPSPASAPRRCATPPAERRSSAPGACCATSLPRHSALEPSFPLFSTRVALN